MSTPSCSCPEGFSSKEVLQLAELAYAGDVQALLDSSSESYGDEVTHRRPEEILSQA